MTKVEKLLFELNLKKTNQEDITYRHHKQNLLILTPLTPISPITVSNAIGAIYNQATTDNIDVVPPTCKWDSVFF